MKRTRKNVPHFPSLPIMTNIIIRNLRCVVPARVFLVRYHKPGLVILAETRVGGE